MAEYRLFFTNERGAIEAKDEFRAETDMAAVTIASLLWEACSECYAGYELWSFSRQIVHAPDGIGVIPPPQLDGVARDYQQVVLDREDALQRSRWRVANSIRLLQATSKLREKLNGTRITRKG